MPYGSFGVIATGHYLGADVSVSVLRDGDGFARPILENSDNTMAADAVQTAKLRDEDEKL